MEAIHFAIAFLSGLIPALFWLWFWLREDREKPEPWHLIALAFIAGMIVVPLVLPLQKAAIEIYSNANLVWVWVIIEELLKYAVALAVILWNKAVDEPIDLIIYLIAIALGFAALENALFVYNPLASGDIAGTALTGVFRFFGATLLHVLASGTIGAFLALAFYKSNAAKILYGVIGLVVATILHGIFNLTIMTDQGGEIILGVFLFVWMGIIILFLVFEKVKILEARHTVPLTKKL